MFLWDSSVFIYSFYREIWYVQISREIRQAQSLDQYLKSQP